MKREEILKFATSRGCIAITKGEAFNAHKKLSTKYSPIDTANVMIELANKGFPRTTACGQQGVRIDYSRYAKDKNYQKEVESKKSSAKHYVIMAPSTGGPYQILIVNSHRGNMAMRILVGKVKYMNNFQQVLCDEVLLFNTYKHTKEYGLSPVNLVTTLIEKDLPVAKELDKKLQGSYLSPMEVQTHLQAIAELKKRKGKPVVDGASMIQKYYNAHNGVHTFSTVLQYSMRILVQTMATERKMKAKEGIDVTSTYTVESDMTLARKVREYVVAAYYARVV